MWLLTSLVDPKLYPRSHMTKLYRQRWEIELGYDDMKTHLLDATSTLRSKKPEGVKQELWGMLLAQNLIRYWILSVAQKRRCSPLRISFVKEASLSNAEIQLIFEALLELPTDLRDIINQLYDDNAVDLARHIEMLDELDQASDAELLDLVIDWILKGRIES
ncbi:MAG: transposase [Myxococcales bacterium]|nr:MAG: transposase [Myxococcales bacterium]